MNLPLYRHVLVIPSNKLMLVLTEIDPHVHYRFATIKKLNVNKFLKKHEKFNKYEYVVHCIIGNQKNMY